MEPFCRQYRHTLSHFYYICSECHESERSATNSMSSKSAPVMPLTINLGLQYDEIVEHNYENEERLIDEEIGQESGYTKS